MKMCRVKGTVVATVKHPAFQGHKLLIVQPIDERGADAGTSFLAVDLVQAGEGDRVLVMQEGNGVRQILKAPKLPIRSVIAGIIDEVSLTPELVADLPAALPAAPPAAAEDTARTPSARAAKPGARRAGGKR